MRKTLFRLAIATAVLTAGVSARASEPPPQTPHPHVGSVTDSKGNPVPLRPHAAERTNQANIRHAEPEIQRGQEWWPYSAALPPYTAVNRRPEAMSETEIQINGVAVIDTRDLEATFRLMPKELKLDEGAQLARTDGFYLVKIAGFSRTQEQIDALTRAGAVLGEYLNINTYLAKIPSSSLASVRALSFVTYVGDYQPAYKISPRIGLEVIPVDEAIDPVTGDAKPWVFEVNLHKGAYVNEVLSDLARIGIFPAEEDIVSNDALTTVLVRTAPDAVPALSQIPGVKWIAEKAYPHLLASATNPATIPMVLQNNGSYTTNKALGWKLWNAGIDGSVTNQIITMMDSGLNSKMFHFSQDTLNNGTVGPAHRKIVGYDPYGSGDQCVLDNASGDGGHGAKTSQHAVGSISNMTSNPDVTHTPNENWDNGIARGGKVNFQDIGNSAGSIGPPLDLGPSITAAIVRQSWVQNHSWGAANNSYDTEASLLDTALFNNPDFVVTVSAGNRGAGGINTLGSPSTAKNAICVGGNDVSNPNSLFIDCNWDAVAACSSAGDLGSSRGPVNGALRTKPDIMTFIWSNTSIGGEQMAYDSPSAMCQTDGVKTPYFAYTNLGNEGGTSFAAPEVGGLALLVRDYFQQGFYPSGIATPGNAFTPRGSLVKAILLASGEDMNATSAPSSFAIGKRYSSDVGYGRANVPGVLHIGSGAPFLWVQNGDALGQSATKSFSYNINGNAIPLRVMMVYYDAAGDALQKDADLKVTVNGATIYWGNNFTGGWSTSATTTRDHTNNTEGVFLDAAHGLPASGTVLVEVIGFNNPGGMNYSLVVSGNVASAAVQQVSLNKGVYTCNEPINITVNDSLATSPVSVTVVSKNSLSATIDTKVVSCTGSAGVFTGSIQTGSGLTVADGGSISVTYAAATPATATVTCQASLTDGGFLIGGGCDNAAAGTNQVSGPLFNGGINEFYTKYMDAGEYTSYKMAFVNNTGQALTDVYVALSFSGGGASKMTALNGPVHIGPVAIGGTAGAVFQLFTDPSATGVPFPTSVNLDFDVTSPGDGFTAPKRLTQPQLLQANDTILRQNRCSTFNAAITPWVESVVTGGAANPWRWSGSATTPSIVGSENRTDGICSNSTASAAAMVGNSAIASGFNFASGADSVLLQNFQPALTGNAPNGQPYHYAWKWHSFYHASETFGATTGVWGVFYNDKWNNPVNPTGDQVADTFPISLAYFYQTIFDYVGTWNWETANTGTPDDPNAVGPPNQMTITFSNVTGLATPSSYFSYGHEHADLRIFGGVSTALTRRDIAFDNDNLVYDEFAAEPQSGPSCIGAQPPVCPPGPVCKAAPGERVCSGEPSKQCHVDADCSPGTCVGSVLGVGGTVAGGPQTIAGVVLTGATNLSLATSALGTTVTFRVVQTNPALDAVGTVVATDSLGGTCTVPVSFRNRAEGAITPASPETICTLAENYSFNVNSAPSSPAGTTACSSHLAGCDGVPGLPAGYVHLPDNRALTIRSPIAGAGVQMEMTRGGTFNSSLRLFFSTSTDFGATFSSPYADVTTSTTSGSSIIRGTGQWVSVSPPGFSLAPTTTPFSDVKVAAGVPAPVPIQQLGQVAFDQVAYAQCANGQAVLSVVDADGVSGMQVTVTSPGTGDSELVTLTGSAPYFSGTLTLSTTTGIGTNNGTLFILPTETINASYNDASPLGSSSAVAATSCTGGDVQYVANAQIVDNGDNDGIPDNNECVTMDVTIKNNTAASITNTKVTIISNNSNVDLIQDDHAYYGTVTAGSSAVNPVGDRFTFHVNEAVACSDPVNPPIASFTVIITADGIAAPIALQTFQVNIDLNVGGGTSTYTQNFSVNPGWTTGLTSPDNAGCTANTYTNDFHWCAACGNAGGGYGAWVGNAAFGTVGQNYSSVYNSSTLYSPVFTAAGPTTLQFRTAYRTEVTAAPPTIYDGAIVQYQLGAGGWTTLGYTTPTQVPTTAGNFCSPILAGSNAWGGTTTGTAWTLTNAAAVPSANGQSLQFRWRLGADVSVNGTSYGGFGVDDVSVTGLRQFVCEPNNNANAPCCLAPSLLVNNTAVDLNLCVSGGVRIQWPKDPDNWGDGGAGTRTYDVLRNGSPIATGIAYGTTTFDDATAVAGTTYSYTVRYNNGCGGQTTTTGASKADSNNVTCTASDQCHNAGVCAPATGVCSNPPKTNGTGCTDGDLCTQTDTCQSGVCVGGNPIVCFQQDQCHQIGTCSAGVCNNPLQPDGSACDDSIDCTNNDQCTAGSCAGTPQAPGELVNARFNDKTTFAWDSVPNSPLYDILRGAIGALPVGPGGGDESCFDNHNVSLLNDATTPAAGQGFFYLVRAANACGQGNYGTQKDLTPRTTTTCP